ncbi:MAG: hypothetical protein MUF15_23360, partial [Acidobacteria bacterium]|nr:hypothetical protein [Acidobacteriota bacterium]
NEFEKIQKKFLLNTKYYNQVKSSLLHYDIKPANIIYNKISKKVTLIDFELTRFGDINSEFTRAFVLSEKFSNIHNKIIIPMLKNIYGNCYNDFINSDLFHIYSLYHMMALYNFLTTDNLYDVTIYAKKIKSLISDLLTSAIFL